MKKFLAGLRKYATVKEGCKVAGINRTTAYKWRKRWKWFDDEWKMALEDAYDSLEEVAWDRATEPQYKNDRMIQFLLRGGRKEKYSDRVETSVEQVSRATVVFTGVDWFDEENLEGVDEDGLDEIDRMFKEHDEQDSSAHIPEA